MEWVALMGGAAAIVWGAAVLLRGGLVAGCLAVLVCGIFFGYPWMHWKLGPIAWTTDRVLWVAVLAQYGIWRRLGLADPKPWRRADIALAAFLLVLGASTLTHDWRADEYQPVARLVFFYLLPAGLYWVARQAPIGSGNTRLVVLSWSVLGVYLAATAVAEATGQYTFVFPRYIASQEYPEFLGRGRGPLLNPVGNGILMGTGLAAVILGWPGAGRWGKLAVVASAGVIAAGLGATLTRSVWMAGAATGVLVVGLMAPKAWRGALAVGLVAAVLLAAACGQRMIAFQRDRGLSERETAESVQLRPILAEIAWRMFCDSPLVGCGFGQYLNENRYYLVDRTSERPLEKARPYVQHTLLLSLLVETGLLGAGLLLLVLGLWLRDAWHTWRADHAPPWARQGALLFMALWINYMVNGLFHEVSLIPMVNAVMFFGAGMNAGCAARMPAGPVASPRLQAGSDGE